MGLLFYDYEVFEYDWLVVIIDPFNHEVIRIHNDGHTLHNYFDKHRSDIWVGYNNNHYDQYIHKAAIMGMNVKKVNDFIIKDKRPGYAYSNAFENIKMINFDVMMKNDGGLKSLEGYMGEDIRETSVPFDIKRPLTPEEIEESFGYCQWDVEKTIDVFLERKAEFDAAMGIIKAFNLPLSYIGKTNAQKVAKILGGNYGRITHDQFDFPIVETLQLVKYAHLQKWYIHSRNYEEFQTAMIAGIPHVLRWGGIHGAVGKIEDGKAKALPYHGTGIFIMADVTAYYPSLQILYGFGYRSMNNPENLAKIHGENLRFKAMGDKAARLPYKIADNAISGQLKDPKSSLYDPRENNAVCVNGQLLLVDLIEKLEPYIELIQSNTDGILFKIPSWNVFDIIDDIVYSWENRTGMRMGFDYFTEIWQKDVNNYVAIDKNGNAKTKGAYVKELGRLDYNLPIVNKALVDYMVKKIPIEKTINECDELIMFQMIFKLSSVYWRTWHNGVFMAEKCHRVFASKNPDDTYIGKCKKEGATIERFANTPDHCFIHDECVKDLKVDDRVDKQWYIDLTYKRLEQFGG